MNIDKELLFEDLRKVSKKFKKDYPNDSLFCTRDYYRKHGEYNRKYEKTWKSFKSFRDECFSEEIKNEVKIQKESEGPNLNIVSTSSKIRTLEQLLSFCRVDLNLYKVKKHIVNSWGSEENECFQVKAWLETNNSSIDLNEEYKELLEDAKKYMPIYEKINYSNNKENGELLEISLFDHHFGQLSWAEETGYDNYDIKIAEKSAIDSFINILNRIKNKNISKILLPIGNDFFNVNSVVNTTVKGTFQSEDERWKKTFRNGRKLWVTLIEMCMNIAPVDVLIIPGNHDEERIFYLGDSLECWFNKCKDVNIDNTAKLRKYYQWGKNLIMFTHGEKEAKGMLINLMPTEEPIKWSQSIYREIHKGHYHHAKQTTFQVLDEVQGIREWILPSLVSLDDWHSGKGYSALRETIAMIWDKEKGKTEMIFYHL